MGVSKISMARPLTQPPLRDQHGILNYKHKVHVTRAWYQRVGVVE